MSLHVQYRRYRLPFRHPVRTAHGVWAEREGVIVRVQDKSESGSGAVGWGEAAPIPWFGTETADEIEAACRELGERCDVARLESVPQRLGCLRHALNAAQAEIGAAAVEHPAPAVAPEASARDYFGVAALLPAGRAVLERIPPLVEAGFRVFKWKVGVGDVADELALFSDVCGALPSGARLRLDANGAWDRRQAERWLDRCADAPVEFVEQPAGAEPAAGRPASSVSREMDLLLGLAADFPTPIALDESLVGERDLERWLGAGWPGVYVVKPSLLADPAAALSRLERARAAVVFSSALETAVGAWTALRTAFAWGGERRALGFGVWPLFADPRCNGPMAAPFIRVRDLDHLDREAAWTALS
ncbi:MAG: o-succinylbenzoate synthase [Opitutaceae bacterium]|nr:o-succinylbenzoate synthase [Opitutaceae bacterium]